jgi:hypothetical protein
LKGLTLFLTKQAKAQNRGAFSAFLGESTILFERSKYEYIYMIKNALVKLNLYHKNVLSTIMK